MKHRERVAIVMLILAGGLAPTAGAQVYVQSTHEDFPRILYADTLVSANDRCIVAQSKLNRRVRPVYVNGVPIGFC